VAVQGLEHQTVQRVAVQWGDH